MWPPGVIFLILPPLRLNSYIGLKKQLAKIRNSSLDTSHSTRNLGFILDEHLDSSRLWSPKPAAINLVNFAVFGLTSIRQLPLLPLSFTPNFITACDSRSLL